MKRLMVADQPFGHLDEKDVKRLVVLSSLAMGGIGGVLLLGFMTVLGVVDHVVIGVAVGCAAILVIPALIRMGLPVRGGAWMFVSVMLTVCLYVSLDASEGVTSGLLMYLSALMLFTGAALGARALVIVGLVTVAAIAGLTALDVYRWQPMADQRAPVNIIVDGIKHVGAVAISIVMVLGALIVFSRAMAEVRAARDEARRFSDTKSAFIANTSHEIRTPLNGILGMTQVLEATDLSPLQRRHLETIADSGRALLAVLNDVLDLAKVEAGLLTVSAAPTDVPALLSGVIAPWRPPAEQKGLAMSLQIAADLPSMLEIDGARVRQCVENLVSNAIKFTDAGAIRIHAHGRGEGDAHILTIAVEDTGAGVTADELPEIFEPFQQLDHPDRPQLGGTGLGLAIVRDLARLMGGDLTGISEIGRGSTFTLTVKAPVAAAEQAAAAAPGGALLLIGPDAARRKAARAMLEQTGRTVTETAGISDALNQCAGAEFDGVLIDADTPGLADAGALDQLRRNLDGGERGLIFIDDETGAPALCDRLGLADCVVLRAPLRKAALTAAIEAMARNAAPCATAATAPINLAPPGLLSAAGPS